jgi:hypothetical protein
MLIACEFRFMENRIINNLLTRYYRFLGLLAPEV